MGLCYDENETRAYMGLPPLPTPKLAFPPPSKDYHKDASVEDTIALYARLEGCTQGTNNTQSVNGTQNQLTGDTDMNETNKAETSPLSENILSKEQQSNKLQFKHAEQQLIDYVIEQKSYIEDVLKSLKLTTQENTFFFEMYRLACLLEYEQQREEQLEQMVLNSAKHPVWQPKE